MASVSDEPKPSTGGECFRPKRIILREYGGIARIPSGVAGETRRMSRAAWQSRRVSALASEFHRTPLWALRFHPESFPAILLHSNPIWILFDLHLRIWGLLEF